MTIFTFALRRAKTCVAEEIRDARPRRIRGYCPEYFGGVGNSRWSPVSTVHGGGIVEGRSSFSWFATCCTSRSRRRGLLRRVHRVRGARNGAGCVTSTRMSSSAISSADGSRLRDNQHDVVRANLSRPDLGAEAARRDELLFDHGRRFRQRHERPRRGEVVSSSPSTRARWRRARKRIASSADERVPVLSGGRGVTGEVSLRPGESPALGKVQPGQTPDHECHSDGEERPEEHGERRGHDEGGFELVSGRNRRAPTGEGVRAAWRTFRRFAA